jgi:hypothetical protein
MYVYLPTCLSSFISKTDFCFDRLTVVKTWMNLDGRITQKHNISTMMW